MSDPLLRLANDPVAYSIATCQPIACRLMNGEMPTPQDVEELRRSAQVLSKRHDGSLHGWLCEALTSIFDAVGWSDSKLESLLSSNDATWNELLAVCFNLPRTVTTRPVGLAPESADNAHAGVPNDEAWWHTQTEQRPAEYKYGPTTGTKAELSHWLGEKKTKTPRRLEQKARSGLVWVIRNAETSWEMWFKDEVIFDAVTRKRKFG
jgi:hypothetical protein